MAGRQGACRRGLLLIMQAKIEKGEAERFLLCLRFSCRSPLLSPASSLMARPAFSPLLLLERDEKKRLSSPSVPESDLTAIASSSSRKKRRPPSNASTAPLDCEMDSIVHRYAEQIKDGISEIHRRHCEAMTLAVDVRLREREAQTERLWIENAALQEKLRALAFQNQQLFTVARRCEAVSVTLRARLEAIIRQNDAAACEREGLGDTCEVKHTESSCGRKEVAAVTDGWRYRCRVCGEREVSVMVIPCQHLCLCLVCEVVAGECIAPASPNHQGVWRRSLKKKTAGVTKS